VAADGRAVLLDFNVACLLDQCSGSQKVGSPGYVAPEVILSKPYDYRVDIFGTGCLAYYLCSRRSPFFTQPYSESAIFRKTVACEVRFGQCFDAVSSEYMACIAWLLVRDYRERPTAHDALQHAFFGMRFRTDAQIGELASLDCDRSLLSDIAVAPPLAHTSAAVSTLVHHACKDCVDTAGSKYLHAGDLPSTACSTFVTCDPDHRMKVHDTRISETDLSTLACSKGPRRNCAPTPRQRAAGATAPVAMDPVPPVASSKGPRRNPAPTPRQRVSGATALVAMDPVSPSSAPSAPPFKGRRPLHAVCSDL
jgi:serine/threonine protein kinase